MAGVTSWTFTLGWVLAGTGCLTRGCLVSFGFEREADGEVVFVVDHYEPGRRVVYRRYAGGFLVTEPDELGREIAAELFRDHDGGAS